MSKVEEYLRKQLNPAPSWTRQSVVFDFDDLCKYAQAYADQEVKRKADKISDDLYERYQCSNTSISGNIIDEFRDKLKT